MKPFLFFVLLILLWPVVAMAQVPLVEREPVVWLSADRCGDTAGVWQDLTGNGYHAVFQGQQVPDTALFNFNRAFLLDISAPGFSIGYRPDNPGTVTVFVVYQSADTAVEQAVWRLHIDSAATAGLTTHRMVTARKPIVYTHATTAIPVLNTMLQNWRVRNPDTLVQSMVLAGSDSLGFTGKLAEFILFDGALPRHQFVRIHSYLAIKYGITLRDMDYVNGLNEVVWCYRDQQGWNHDVAAIAADTLLGLWQPQGAGMGGGAPLTIAAGTLAPEVALNTGTINHGDFLIWGDNGEALGVPEPDTTTGAQAVVPNLIDRRWQMLRSGATPHLIPTQVVFPGMLPDSSVVLTLVRDTTGSGRFHSDSVIVYHPDSTDAAGNLYFNNIFWSSAGGREVFTFQAFKQGVFVMSEQQTGHPGGDDNDPWDQTEQRIRCTLFPNPTPGHYSLIIALPDEEQVVVTVFDQAGREVDRQVLPPAALHHHRGELPHKGIYLINVTTSSESRTLKLIVN
jgi:hypothetical protein